MKKIIAIIPSYCPSEKLIEIVNDLCSHSITCVVVNDGSSKEYDYIFSSLNCNVIVLKHLENKGKGYGLKTAMRYIYDNFDDATIVCVDGDGQHLSTDVLKCANLASSETNSLILGTRLFNKNDVPFKSYYGNKITELVFKLATNIHISDTQTGLRAFDYKLLKDMLMVEGDRYEYEINQLLYCVKNNIDIKEINIETVYEGNNECSHFNVLGDSYLIYKQLIKFSLSSFSSFLIDYFVFILISNISNSILLGNVVSRIVSSIFNYEFNRKIVFDDKENRRKSLFKYFGLVLFVFICNTLILYFLTYSLKIDKAIGKIIIELIMFIVSYNMQKRFVFAKGV